MTARKKPRQSAVAPTPCRQDPDRWALATGPDPDAIQLCRDCPRRWACAQEAGELPDVSGICAGVFVPATGRARAYALCRLRALAEHGRRSS